MNQTLATPTGAKYVYSDLSMITMMYAIGKIVRTTHIVIFEELNKDCATAFATGPWQDQCFYEAFVRLRVLGHINLNSTQFLLSKPLWAGAAPTWNESSVYRHRCA